VYTRQSYGTSLSIWDHTSEQRTRLRKAGTRLTFPGGIEGWVDLGGWLHTVKNLAPLPKTSKFMTNFEQLEM